MGVDLIFKIATIGIIVSILHQLMVQAGRQEQGLMITLAGLVIVLMMVAKEVLNLFETVRAMFQF